jgi:hypothetical protein
MGKINHPPTARVPAEPMPTGASWKRTVFLTLFRSKIKFRHFRQELLRGSPERAAIRRFSGGCFCVSLSGAGLMLSLSQFELSTYLIIFSGISAVAWWCSLDFLNQKQTVRRKVLQTHNRFGQVVGSILIAISAAWVTHLIDDYALEKELQLHTDWLVPASDPQPKTSCPVVDGALQILLGNSTVYATISVDRKPQLVLDRDDQGRVAVTGNIFDENDDAIAEIDRNHFTVDSDVFKLARPDRSTLSVTIKKHKEEVLSIRFVNSSTIRIKGVFRYRNTPRLVVGDSALFLPDSNNTHAWDCMEIQPGISYLAAENGMWLGTGVFERGRRP